LQKKGRKIVAYIAGGLLPEELIGAAGAIPVGLVRGGDHEAVLKSLEFLPRYFDTFSRAQIGYWALEEPLYRMPDLIVVPCTDKNITAIADCFEMWTDKKIVKFGIPHSNKDEDALNYYLESLHILKDEIESLTGNPITEERLLTEIKLLNGIRALLRKISEMRKSKQLPLSGKDFITLHHASFVSDRQLFRDLLESIYKELRERPGVEKSPRIFLIGSSMAYADYKIYEIIESMGADVVIEDFSEGFRPYWRDVETNGSPINALADAYFRKATPLPFFRPAQAHRISFLLELARDFKVDGIIHYSMMYREPYEIEGVYLGQVAAQKGIPFLRITSEYNPAERTVLRNRIEAFVESMGRPPRRRWDTKAFTIHMSGNEI
jgi:benzoyl-CoA reductase/2-hydroxyglutaryl-CoA dehydratase subunit BcrC/BadD/HgdB